MSRITNFRKLGDTILERIAALPAHLREPVEAHVHAFQKVHTPYTHACDGADKGREVRDAVLTTITAADKAHDVDIGALADRLVGAGLGTRRNAFVNFSPHAPGALGDLPHDKAIKATKELVEKVLAAKPAAEVQKAAVACQHAAEKLEKATGALAGPQTAFQVAMAQRDAMLEDWGKALARLKKHCDSAWFDHPGTFDAVFGNGRSKR